MKYSVEKCSCAKSIMYVNKLQQHKKYRAAEASCDREYVYSRTINKYTLRLVRTHNEFVSFEKVNYTFKKLYKDIDNHYY